MKLSMFNVSPIWPHPITTTPYSGGLEIHYFHKNSFAHQNYSIVTYLFLDISTAVEKSVFKEIRHFRYMTNISRPFLGLHYYALSFLYMPLIRKDYVWRNESMLHFYPQDWSEGLCHIHSLYPYPTNADLVKIFASSSAEEDVNAYPKEHDVLSIMIHTKTH